MRLAIPAGFALASLTFFSVQQPQPPPPKPPVEKPEVTRSKGELISIKKLEDQMQGTWRLTQLESPFIEKENRQDVGFMVVSGNYLSLEMHLGWAVSSGGRLDHRDFLSGTHRFELDERGRMTTSTVIGAAFDKRGNLVFEPPATRREYDIAVTNDRLVMSNDDGRKLTFERMLDPHLRHDIYGRPIKEKPTEDGKVDAGAPKKDAPKPQEPPKVPKDG